MLSPSEVGNDVFLRVVGGVVLLPPSEVVLDEGGGSCFVGGNGGRVIGGVESCRKSCASCRRCSFVEDLMLGPIGESLCVRRDTRRSDVEVR